MKAISKSYGNFEVRFSTPSMFNLKRLSTYDSFENSGLVNAEINFKGVWYPVTLEYKMLNKDCRIPVAVLSKKAADAFGVEYDFNREPAIMLDKDYDQDYKSFIAEQVEAARAKANTCDFSQVHIATYWTPSQPPTRSIVTRCRRFFGIKTLTTLTTNILSSQSMT